MMILLILGVALWWAAHGFKRVAPDARAAMGSKGRIVVTIALLASVVLMVIGYRGAEFTSVYSPIPGIGHLSVLLMVVALWLAGVGAAKGVVASKIRHPMLTGVLVWTLAHLLVNGDVASLVLFGGIGLWAPVQMMLINRHEGAWDRPAAGPVSKDIRVVVVAVIMALIIAAIHIFLGHNPFMGTYA